MLIGVISSGLIEDYTVNVCRGIEMMAADNNVKCVIIPGKYFGVDYEKELKNKYGYCYNSLFSYGLLSCFDGLIIEMASVMQNAGDEEKSQFAKMFEGIPHVFISYDKEGYSSVTIDNKVGLNDAFEYMLANGAKKYAMIGGPDNNVDAMERRECFEAFIRRHNLEYSDKSYVAGSFFLDCSKEMEMLVENNLDADVFVCANDILAKRMYAACDKYNIKPGTDVSILGFDDSDFCVSTYPTISSVRTDIIEVGKESFSLLLEILEGKQPRKAIVPSRFILRDSICHREKASMESDTQYDIQGFIKSNIHIEDHSQLLEINEKLMNCFEIIKSVSMHEIDEVQELLSKEIDSMLLSDGMKYIDWELLVNYIDVKYQAWIADPCYTEYLQKITLLYMEFLKKMMKFGQTLIEGDGIEDMDNNYQMMAFFRETMQFARNGDYNYSRFLENLDFLGIENAYLYMFDEEISYIQGEIFDVPEFLNLKAVLKQGKPVKVSQGSQRIHKNRLFDNEYVDWKAYERLILFPIYSENYLYGLIVCDMRSYGFGKSDIFTTQISSAIRMLQLRIENNMVVNEYEDSVRRLKEYNITLDTMSKTDPLTGLNNRRGFYVRTENIKNMYPNDQASMMIGYADMNDLKIINDRFGHDDGDYALKTIGSILTDFVTMNNGFAARIGGDEFTFVLAVPKGSNPVQYRNEIYRMFDDFNLKSIKPYNISISVGYCLIGNGDNISIDEALSIADERLYSQKLLKKGNVIK